MGEDGEGTGEEGEPIGEEAKAIGEEAEGTEDEVEEEVKELGTGGGDTVGAFRMGRSRSTEILFEILCFLSGRGWKEELSSWEFTRDTEEEEEEGGGAADPVCCICFNSRRSWFVFLRSSSEKAHFLISSKS